MLNITRLCCTLFMVLPCYGVYIYSKHMVREACSMRTCKLISSCSPCCTARIRPPGCRHPPCTLLTLAVHLYRSYPCTRDSFLLSCAFPFVVDAETTVPLEVNILSKIAIIKLQESRKILSEHSDRKFFNSQLVPDKLD